MTPEEEELVLELHARWGNRWSRIARKLPGRTDNEIKNYWRTHMRKKAQERKLASSPSSSPRCHSASPPLMNSESSNSTGENRMSHDRTSNNISPDAEVKGEKGSLVEQNWKEITVSDMIPSPPYENCHEEGCDHIAPSMASPLWDYCPDSLWCIEDELPPFVSRYGYGRES